MNTRLSKKETMVYGNIGVMADVIGGNKYFTFAELYEFDLDNTKDELKEILNSLTEKGYLKSFHDFYETYRVLK